MKSNSFCELFCAHYGCKPAEFNEAILRSCFSPGRYYPARLLALVHQGHFKDDFVLIESVKPLTSAEAVAAEVISFRDMHPQSGVLRGLLNLRLSSKRIVSEAERLFAGANGKTA